jgi:hypothetical protein
VSLLEEPRAIASELAATTSAPPLPPVVGPLSRYTVALLRDLVHSPGVTEIVGLADLDDPLADLDFQLSLYCLHELHFRSFAGVHPDAEWHPSVVDWWHRMAGRFEAALLAEVPVRALVAGSAGDTIEALVVAADGPSLSQYVLDHASPEILREFAIHRSAYQLKEADPHSFALPRFGGPAKSAFVEIQMDEYGNGVPGRAHAELFATSMDGLGLDPSYGRYLAALPATTLATTNLITHLALHRRLLPALLGHLALFEMTSVTPMGRYAAAMRKIGAPEEACVFYDVHVVADEHHGPLARSVMVDGYVAEHPGTAPLAVWGAEITMAVEEHFARHLLDAWTSGDTSLSRPS